MAQIKEYIFDYPNGYAARHTEECVKKLNNRKRGPGRIPYRYDIIKRDGTGETVVIANVTRPQLLAYRQMARQQGNEIR